MLTASTPGAPCWPGPSPTPRTRGASRCQTTSPSASVCSIGSSPTGLASGRPDLPGPFAPAPLQGLHPLLRAGPPLCPASVLCPSRCPPLGVLPLATRGPTSPISTGRRYRDDRFSCSMPAPATSSRHLYTGHHQGNTQAAPWLRARTERRAFVPGTMNHPRFRCHRSAFRCVSSGSLMFVFSSHT